MKKFLYMAMLVTLASCSVNEEVMTAPDIVASTESGTKTSLSVDSGGVGTIYWNPGDSINVFYGVKSAAYASQNAADAVSATFKTMDSITAEELESAQRFGLYPYDKSAVCDLSTITTALPAGQEAVPSTFDRDLFITVAKAEDNSLNFKNVCGGIKFTLSRGDTSRVIVRGNNGELIAGSPLNLALEDDAAYQNLGEKWRLPTYDEWCELRDNCTSEWTSVNGVSGYMLTSKSNANTMFLPAAGCMMGDAAYPGANGFYWSSKLHGDRQEAYACNFYYISETNKHISFDGRTPRWYGGSVRPVLK